MFKMHVPSELESYIEEKFQDLVSDGRIPENYASMLDTNVQHIEHNSRDGFIPFTNGGFNLMLPTDLSGIWSSGYMPSNDKIRETLESVIETSLKDAYENFIQENKETFQNLFPNVDVDELTYDEVNYHSLYDIDQGTLAEQLSEYEQEYLSEGGEFWYQFRAMYYSADNYRNESGKDEILFLAGVNMDFHYGRDNGLEITYEKCIPVELLTREVVDTIFNEMVESI